MNSTISLQYFENEVGKYFEKAIPGCSIFAPMSSNEKGIDLMIYRFENGQNKTVSIQVKSSRIYENHNKKSKRKVVYKNTTSYPMQSMWFNRFEPGENAEWFIIGSEFYKHTKEPNKCGMNDIKKDIILLAFTKDEMRDFMENRVRLVKDPSKKDRMYAFIFDENKNIWQTRGFQEGQDQDCSKYLIENRIDEIIASMH